MKENEFKQGNNQNIEIYDYKLLNNLTEDSAAYLLLDRTFIIFNSINGIINLIYSNMEKSIVSYNLITNKKIIEIKNAHTDWVTNFNHFFDENVKKDFVLSVSASDCNIKLWDINNYECLLNLNDIYNNGEIYSSCFLMFENNNYIISSNYCRIYQQLKIFDFKGNLIKEIDEIKKKTIFIDTFYNKQDSKTYILTGNNGFITSFDYNENKIKHIYDDKTDKEDHSKIIVWPLEYNDNNKNEIYKLIETCDDGFIRVWNFDTGILLKKIQFENKLYLYGICLLNNDYLFVGCSDFTIKVIDLNEGKVVYQLIDSRCIDDIICITFINHPKYGKCLISQGNAGEQIKMWVNKKFLSEN